MSGHYARASGVNKCFKRHEINRVELLLSMIDNGTRLMRVGRRVAVAGKVLGDRHDSAVFETERIGHTETGHPVRVFTKRACADNRV